MAGRLASAVLPSGSTNRHLAPAGRTYSSILHAGKTQLMNDSGAFLLSTGSAMFPPVFVNKFVEHVDSAGEIYRNPALAPTDGRYRGTQTQASGEAAEMVFYHHLDKVLGNISI